jgi:hypothetical protein
MGRSEGLGKGEIFSLARDRCERVMVRMDLEKGEEWRDYL